MAGSIEPDPQISSNCSDPGRGLPSDASCFHRVDSFAMMCGSHLDVCVLFTKLVELH